MNDNNVINGNKKNYHYIKLNNKLCFGCSSYSCSLNECKYNDSHYPGHTWIQIPIVNLNKSLSLLELFLQNNIYPKDFSKDLIDKFNLLFSLYSKGYLKF